MEAGTEVIAPFDVEAINAKSKIGTVDLEELKVDRSYQRDPSQRMVDEIAAEWDVVASELLLVSDRGDRQDEDGNDIGGLWLINGQHRSLAANKKGIKRMAARVIDLSDPDLYPDPGRVESTFRLKTNVRLGDRPLERFRAQVRSGDAQSISIVKLLERFDTQINDTPNSEYGINSVSGIEKLYALDEGKLLTETLEVARDAWGHVGGKTASVALLNSIAWFVLKHAGAADRGRLVEKLRDTGVAALDRRARTIGSTMGGSLWVNYYRAIVDFYNERLQQGSRLEWQLRGAGSWKGRSERTSGGGWGKGPRRANE